MATTTCAFRPSSCHPCMPLRGCWDEHLYFNDSDNYTYYHTYHTNCWFSRWDWCNDEDSLRFEALFLPTLYALALLLGLPGNVLMLAMLFRQHQPWRGTDVFVMNLALADTLLVITLPLWATQAVWGWSFRTPLCKIVGGVFKVNFFCCIFLLTCISLYCYLSIVHHMHFHPRQVWGACLSIWLLGLLLSIPDLIVLEAGMPEQWGGRTKCILHYEHPWESWGITDWQFVCRLLYHVTSLLLSFAIIGFCFICELRKKDGVQIHGIMRNIFRLVLASFLCWLPYNLTLLVDTLNSWLDFIHTCSSRLALDTSLVVTSALASLHCCLNTLLYAFLRKKVRSHLQGLLRSMGCPGVQARGPKEPQAELASTSNCTYMEWYYAQMELESGKVNSAF
ncbi:C-X-C chemokine receptor type 3-like [Amia ocellicauda]|uniref:C-X-C chemokine receptor type 3-like n=1 Tax=Amia ocellicauda TaxID=2972642 RepID=UPI003464DD12